MAKVKKVMVKIEFEVPNNLHVVNDLHEALCKLIHKGDMQSLGFLGRNVFNIVHPDHQE